MEKSLNLEALLQPKSVDAFLSSQLGESPFVVGRQAPQHYDGLLSLGDVDRLVGLSDLPAGALRLLRDGDEVPAKEVNRDAAFRHFGSGGTVALNGLQGYVPAVAEMCAGLATELGSRIQANIYLTPPGGQGFAAHYDDHDVFVLQVVGHKSWSVYADPPLMLPLRGQIHRRTPEAPTPAHGPAIIEALLEQGDLLYIPRGFVHEARSTSVTSLHLTVGLHPVTWSDVVSSALKKVIDADPRFRKAVPPGVFVERLKGQAGTAAIVGELRAALSGLPLEAALAEAVDRFRQGTQPLVGPRIEEMEAAGRLGPESRVARREGVRFVAGRTEDGAWLRFNGKQVDLPALGDGLADFVAMTPEFALGDAPAQLGPQGVRSVVTSLIREGALVIRSI